MLQNEPQTPTNRCGSPAYAAPEVFCNRTHGTGVDIWSIGVCMFAMLMGHLPFLPTKTARLPELHSAVLAGITLPGFLSKDCEDLLTQMLRPQLSERIKMDQLLHHKWLVKGFGNMVPRQPPFSKLTPTVVDSQLTKYLSYVCGYSPNSISQSVHDRQCNHISATYHLLVKSIKRGFRIPDISELELSRHDSSDEFMYSTQTQIMQEYIESILSDQLARSDGISPLHSIPLYKSCIRCLRESRCQLHGPSQVTTTPIGPHKNYQSDEVVPEYVQQYLEDCGIQTVDDLIRMTTDVQSAMQLPEKILAYLCKGFDDGTLTDVPLKDILSPENTNQIGKSVLIEAAEDEYQDEQTISKIKVKEGGEEMFTTITTDEMNAMEEAGDKEICIIRSPVASDRDGDTSDLANNRKSIASEHNIPNLECPVDRTSQLDVSDHSTRDHYTETINSLNGMEQNEDSFGLRDPYAEEIWMAMYPKTVKLQTPIDLSPRRPVVFNSPLSYPKLLTHRQSHNINQSFNFLKHMVASNNNSSNYYSK